MAFSYGFFDSKNLDRVYTAESFTDYLSSLICNGIFDNFGQCFRLTADGGLNLTIGTGKAWIDGHYFLSDTPHTLDLSQYVDESLTKFVAIGISCDTSESVRACKLEVKQGTAATSPTIPTFQNTETKTYLTLCAVRLNGGTTEIVKNNITDYRGNETKCPYVRCILGKCKVSEILDALESYNTTVTELNAQVTELQNRLTEIEAVTGATGVVLVSAGQCGDAVFYALYSDGTLRFNGSGATTDYTGFAILYNYDDDPNSIFRENTIIKKVLFEDAITHIGNWLFSKCSNLESVTLPSKLQTIGDVAFSGTNLKAVTIPNTCKSIGVGAFAHTSLESITIPQSVEKIGNYAFQANEKLKTVVIRCGEVGNMAFTKCTALSSLIIGTNCKRLGSSMLAYCDALAEISYEGTLAQWALITKGNLWDGHGGIGEPSLAKIICTDGYLEYDTATSTWNEVRNDA